MFKMTNAEFDKAHDLYQRLDLKTQTENPVSFGVLIECINAAKERRKSEFSRAQFKNSMLLLERALEPKLGLDK